MGSALVLRDNATRPAARRLVAVSRDTHVDLTDTQGTDEDPTVAGGALRVGTVVGDGFDVQALLPASGWRTIGKPEAPRGYRFKSDGPIRSVTIRTGGVVRIVGSGAALDLSLQADPNPVVVDLTIGARRYCMRFGGDATFKAGRRFAAHAAPAPAQCN